MGLDMYLYKWARSNKAKMLDRIEGNTAEEVYYWRKAYLVHDFFCGVYEVENCKDVEITREDINNLIGYLQTAITQNRADEYYDLEDMKGWIKDLMKIETEFDFENYQMVYHAWW